MVLQNWPARVQDFFSGFWRFLDPALGALGSSSEAGRAKGGPRRGPGGP